MPPFKQIPGTWQLVIEGDVDLKWVVDHRIAVIRAEYEL